MSFPLHRMRCRIALTTVLLLAAAFPAAADLLVLGHEFRPTPEERAGDDPCVAGDGTRARFVFVCNEPSPGFGCPNQNIGKLYAEWRSASDELVGGPVFVAEGGYDYSFPRTCSADGDLAALFGTNLQVVDRDGTTRPLTPVCDTNPCWGPVGVSASQSGFLVAWPQYATGLRARYFDETGAPSTASFVIDGLVSHQTELIAGRLLANGEVFLAWRTPEGIRASTIASAQSFAPAVFLSEFPTIEHTFELNIGLEADDRVLVAWPNEPYQSGWVARRVLVGDESVTTTTTTTSTTLEDPQTLFLAATTLAASPFGNPEYPNGRPELVADSSGRWLAGWLDELGDERGLVASRSVDDAGSWLPIEAMHVDDWLENVRTAVAGDGKGLVVDVWSPDNVSLLVRRSSDGGATWNEPATLYQSEIDLDSWEYDADIDAIAVASGSDGRWVAIWSSYVNYHAPCRHPDCIDWEDETLLCAIRASVSMDEGLTWSSPVTVEDGTCSGNLELATDREGEWVAAWTKFIYQGDDEIRFSSSVDNAGQWSVPETIVSFHNIGYAAPGLALAANRAGQWVLAYSRNEFPDGGTWPDDNRGRIYASRTNVLGDEWTVPAPVAPWQDTMGGFDGFPSLAAGEDGDFGLAWSSNSGGGGLDADIVVAFSGDAGETWSHPHLVDTEAASDGASDFEPHLVRNDSTWAVLWRASNNVFFGGSEIRFAKTRGDCGDGDEDPAEECDDANLVEGDGCDTTCRVTGCGSRIVTDGEDCDDGNSDDEDACIDCRAAVCGDGFVHAKVEDCDDANGVDTDECRNDCSSAICGDAVVRPGIETCDDGLDSGNNDDCLDACAFAGCGDGYLRLGVEQCDDGNSANDDGCTRRCKLESDCLLFGSDGLRVTASDALQVLKRAVGVAGKCPLRSCDVNDDGSISATDSLWTLRSAVGILPEGCSLPSRLVLSLESPGLLGALQVRASYRDAAGHVRAYFTGRPACKVLVSPATVEVNWLKEEGILLVGVISLAGFEGPLDLLECQWDPVSGPSLHDFSVVVEDASDPDSHAVEPPPTVRLHAE